MNKTEFLDELKNCLAVLEERSSGIFWRNTPSILT